MRFNRQDMAVRAALWTALEVRNAETMRVVLLKVSAEPRTLQGRRDLLALTPAIVAMPSLVVGRHNRCAIEEHGRPKPSEYQRVSHKDPEIWVYALWQKREKLGNGSLGAKICDVENRLRLQTTPKKVSLLDCTN